MTALRCAGCGHPLTGREPVVRWGAGDVTHADHACMERYAAIVATDEPTEAEQADIDAADQWRSDWEMRFQGSGDWRR